MSFYRIDARGLPPRRSLEWREPAVSPRTFRSFMIRLYHQNLAYHLRRAAENARSILIVTPYVKIRAIEAIIPRGIRFDELTLVTRGAPDDFASGISDLDALDAVWSLGGEVYRFRIFTRSTTALTGSFSREARISRGAASAWGLIRNGMTKYSPLTSRAARVMSSKRTGGWPRYGFRGTQRGSFGNLLKDGGARVSFRTGSAGGRPRKRARSRRGGSPPALSRICFTKSSGGVTSGTCFRGIPTPVLSRS